MEELTGIAQLVSGGGMVAFAAAVLLLVRDIRKLIEQNHDTQAQNQAIIIEKLTRIDERTKTRWRTPAHGVPFLENGNDD